MRRVSADLSDPSRNIEESVGTPDPSSLDCDLDMALMTTEEDSTRIYTPPPHIAARFYRPTQNRRKDSAASSRRNSISSAQSRSSHGFVHNVGPQSKYIAQQMRRASILEDRKARLADRAAHAEKVRLRAALAKAATQKSSNIEERALAAAQAREKNLAEIVAACAEEVKRAKAVAESMKEKREQELRKLKAQMEERLAEAEKRREELRSRHAARRSRGQSIMTKKSDTSSLPEEDEHESSSMSDVVLMSEDVAVSKIQWWWRGVLKRKAVHQFSELGLNIDSVRDTSFEQVTELLAQENVLVLTARVLGICGLQEGEVGSVNEMTAVRTFLSAFLILGHPTQVLSNKDHRGEQEQVGSSQGQPIPHDDLANPQLQDLVAKARDLLISFENILSRLTSLNNYTTPPAIQGALSESYATFHNAFISWKARDSNALVEVMLLQFVELDAILQSVKDRTEEVVAESYRESIKENQLMLMVRIKRLAGPEQGKRMIFEAVKQARKARAAKKPAGDMRPRVAEHSLSNGNSAEDNATAERVVSQLQTLTPPPTQLREKELKQSVLQPSYPPILPDNRIIVHELAINREYRIEYQHFQEQHKLRLIPLFDDLKANPGDEEKEFHYLIIMANYIRERLQHLVQPGTPMHTFIGEMLDTEVAQRQFLAGSFSYQQFFSSIGSLLPKLCAPVRDDEVKDLVENKLSQGDVVNRLEALLSFIDTMLYDYANYMLQVVAPSLVEHASVYETKRFAEDLDNGNITLSHAETSWRNARNKVHAEVARRDPEGINHPRSRPTPDKIYWQMLLDEFTQPSPLDDTVPEPLALDVKRRAHVGCQTIRIVTAGAILLQCKNMLKRDVRAPWKTEAGRIFTVLESMDDDTKPLPQSTAIHGIMAALEAGRSMPTATKTHLQALVTKVLTASIDARRENTDPREPVLKLLLTRMRGHILARIQAGSASEKVKATSTAGEKLASLGLPEFVEKIRDMVDEIVRVGAVDREAHGIWWEEVAENVSKEDSTPSPAAV
ncbi:T-complex protein 11-domain-containing protein [Annulohypoxylon maeteangense]|uniref:T-complex protein 11-domain-containing protein n=1 Tax=Annulohypoxylon maeteangense TaxID=1927788 RepID=UPI0020086894|nr:T-complex protein 11-domain-containing protein [Annulohypoxylon maeteangense]KAI0884650.1 T-complex protein 11-domain-containing protein [Annulohypoxylon maeteangense]